MINVACVLVGDRYRIEHVNTLFNMVTRHLGPITLHVYTEEYRDIPEPYVKHELPTWGAVINPWWYKMCLFDDTNFSGDLLYFDLDVVVVDDLQWILELDTRYLWAIRDYRRVYEPTYNGYNSSVMWFNTTQQRWLFDRFNVNRHEFTMSFRGDQEFITAQVAQTDRRFIDDSKTASWRWQCVGGGWDFHERKYRQPQQASSTLGASVLVFHGDPKPWLVKDSLITEHYK